MNFEEPNSTTLRKLANPTVPSRSPNVIHKVRYVIDKKIAKLSKPGNTVAYLI